MSNDTQSLFARIPLFASIQLLSPWPLNMVAWFHGLEAQVHCRRTTQELTMYFHVLRMLPKPMIQELGKLLSRPLSSTFYTNLKAELLNLTALSDKKRVRGYFPRR